MSGNASQGRFPSLARPIGAGLGIVAIAIGTAAFAGHVGGTAALVAVILTIMWLGLCAIVAPSGVRL